MPDLKKFNFNEYFSVGFDVGFTKEPLKITLTRNGIELLGQYIANKYQTPSLVIIDAKPVNENNRLAYLENFFQQIHSDKFAEVRKSEKEVRLPIIFTGWHSTPIVYVKQGSKEAFLIFDSIGTNVAQHVAANTQFKVYTVKKVKDLKNPEDDPEDFNKLIRQRDTYSCHEEAVIFIRELTGKDKNNIYFIPDILTLLESQSVNDENQKDNLIEVKLPDRLLITTQREQFFNLHKSESGNEIVHEYQGQSETLEMFIKRYPPDDVTGLFDISGKPKKPDVSSYLREKGVKSTNIIEIQFYLNQLKDILGDKFTVSVMKDFIKKAKAIFKTHGHSFFKEGGENNLYNLAQKFIDENLKLSETKQTSTTVDHDSMKPKK